MTTINGSLFNAWWDWVQVANDSYTTYELCNVFNQWDNGNGDLYIHSLTCADFAWLMFGEMQVLGAVFDPTSAPKHDFINLYSEAPIPVNASDPKWSSQILKFYQDFQWGNQSEEQKIEMFLRFLINDKFILSQGNYYYLKMSIPFFGLHYYTEAFPKPSDLGAHSEAAVKTVVSTHTKTRPLTLV